MSTTNIESASVTEYEWVYGEDTWGDGWTWDDVTHLALLATDYVADHEPAEVDLSVVPVHHRSRTAPGLYRVASNGNRTSDHFEHDPDFKPVRDLIKEAWEHALDSWKVDTTIIHSLYELDDERNGLICRAASLIDDDKGNGTLRFAVRALAAAVAEHVDEDGHLVSGVASAQAMTHHEDEVIAVLQSIDSDAETV